jgi:hypothetical protein
LAFFDEQERRGPIANLLMGSSVGVLFFFPSFVVSSGTGALIAWLIAIKMKQQHLLLNT